MVYRPARPDPDRPKYWPGEENHFRSDLKVGDIVRTANGSGYLGRITAFDHTHSHLRGGRIVHLDALLAYPGTDEPDDDPRPYNHDGQGFWEDGLTLAAPGDVAAHTAGERPFDWRHVSASWRQS